MRKHFKILMILLYLLVFAFQIYYSVSLMMNGLDMAKALEIEKLNYVFEAHPNLLSSRIIIALMQTHSLNVDFLSGLMVVFLILSALNIFDLIYFGLNLIVIYFLIQTRKKGLYISFFTSLSRFILYLILVISGGVAVLQVFLVGNTSVKELIDLGSFVIPVFAVFFFFCSILSLIASLKLELREA